MDRHICHKHNPYNPDNATKEELEKLGMTFVYEKEYCGHCWCKLPPQIIIIFARDGVVECRSCGWKIVKR